MGLFQHPHLTRGIVHTAKGGFAISRGLVELPDDIGESYGWRRVDEDDEQPGHGFGWDQTSGYNATRPLDERRLA